MRHFLFEEKEYRYRPYFKRCKEIYDSVVELARILRLAEKYFFNSDVRRQTKDFRQKCTVKMQYSSSIQAHKKQLEDYLVREGTDIDGYAAQLFGTNLDEYRSNMSGRNFRIFLSPQSNNVDLQELTEKFIEKLQRQSGYRLFWQGACHYNTAHPHAHLLINGFDKTGKEVFFPRDMVKTFMRENARDICTLQIGGRSQQDIEREKEQELTAPRYTKLDDRIHNLCSGVRKISLKSPVIDKKRILARLEALRKLNLCTYESGGYVLKENWQDDLKANGRYNTFLKARESLMYTDPSLLMIYTGEQGFITGKVTKIYRTDGDASDNHAVVLEALDGKAFFIPLLRYPQLRDGEKKINLKEGEIITVTTYKSQKGRLTPLFYKRDIKKAQKDVSEKNYKGALAVDLMKIKDSDWHGKNVY